MLAFFPVFPVAMVAALILGLGYGMYLAVDQALVTQVLPRAIDRGRDLGVINIANARAAGARARDRRADRHRCARLHRASTS